MSSADLLHLMVSLAQSASDAALPPRITYGAIGGPLEVAIGIAVAYLAFDRFRYHKRVQRLAEKTSTGIMDTEAVIRQFVADNVISNDEKGFLVLLYYSRDAKFRESLAERLKALQELRFHKSVACFVLQCLLVWKVDRRIIQAAVVIFCAWELVVAYWLYGLAPTPAWVSTPEVGLWIFALIAVALLTPAITFVISEWMMLSLRASTKEWQDGIEVQLKKSAADAKAPNNGPSGNDAVLAEEPYGT